jgi:hypothetical protein
MAQNEVNLSTSQLIKVQHIFRSFLSLLDGLDEAKKPFHTTVPLRSVPGFSIAFFYCVADGVTQFRVLTSYVTKNAKCSSKFSFKVGNFIYLCDL